MAVYRIYCKFKLIECSGCMLRHFIIHNFNMLYAAKKSNAKMEEIKNTEFEDKITQYK